MVAGLLYSRSRWQCVIALYRSIIAAMVAGRIVWGAVEVILLGISGSAFTWKAFMAGRKIRSDNLNAAYKKVKANKGAGGIDGMQVDGFLSYLRERVRSEH